MAALLWMRYVLLALLTLTVTGYLWALRARE